MMSAKGSKVYSGTRIIIMCNYCVFEKYLVILRRKTIYNNIHGTEEL